METIELLERAQEIASWYEEKDIMWDDNNRPYVMIETETDHSDEYRVEFKKRYLDY